MKKTKILMLLMLVALVPTSHAQVPPQLRNQWSTGWVADLGLPLCLHWKAMGDSLMPQLYSPLQDTAALLPSSWSWRNDTLRFRHKEANLRLTLAYETATGHYTGTLRQGIYKLRVEFLPDTGLLQLRRPQTPQRPYAFDEETITVEYRDKKGATIHLEGSLALPKGVSGRCPAVLLVSGSGQQDRDEEIVQHRPFLVIADYLARHGIATLRYDDRGVGGSKGDVQNATTYDFANDAEQMFKALRRHKRIDRHHCGIAGHSEGGMIAPIVAARNSKVDFIVLLAGPGCSGADVLVQQNEALFLAQGIVQPLAARRAHFVQRMIDTVLHSPTAPTASAARFIVDQERKGLTEADCDAIQLNTSTAIQLVQQLQTPWMKAFLTLNPASYLAQVRCPILALNGERDRQVLCEPNMASIYLATDGRATQHRLPGLNHLFQHCHTGGSQEYALIEETFAPEALELMGNWIRQVAERR